MLFVSDKELQDCQTFSRGGARAAVSVSVMTSCGRRRTVQSVIHPVTGEPISPLIGRMAAFIPTNIPTAMGMLMHSPTSTGAMVFWQWANQTYNSINNYANRSAKEVDMPRCYAAMAWRMAYLAALRWAPPTDEEGSSFKVVRPVRSVRCRGEPESQRIANGKPKRHSRLLRRHGEGARHFKSGSLRQSKTPC